MVVSGILRIMFNGQVPKIPDIPCLYYFYVVFRSDPHNRYFFNRLCGFILSPNNLITSLPRTSSYLSSALILRVRRSPQKALLHFRRDTEPFPKECLKSSIDTCKKNNYIKTHPANPMTCRVRNSYCTSFVLSWLRFEQNRDAYYKFLARRTECP